MAGLAAIEEVPAEPGVAVHQARSVAELGIELATARAQRHGAEAAGRTLRRIIPGRRKPHRQAAMLDAKWLSDPEAKAIAVAEHARLGEVEAVGAGLEPTRGEIGPAPPSAQ